MHATSRSSRYRRVRRYVNTIIERSTKKTNVVDSGVCNSKSQSVPVEVLTNTLLLDEDNDLADSDCSSDISISNSSVSSSSSSTSEEQNSDSEYEDSTKYALTSLELKQQLATWATQHNVTHTAITHLLHIIQGSVSDNLPVDARTLLKTPTKTMLKPTKIEGGNFYYFGVEPGIQESCKLGLTSFQFPLFKDKANNLLTIRIGVDGLPISRSSKSQLWPILGLLDQAVERSVFIIAIYHGFSKPSNVEAFFVDFIKEMIHLQNNGIHILNSLYNVRISAICADAPARAFLKQCSIFNGYYGCERCVQKGTWIGRVVFEEMSASLRTDESFRDMTQSNHHSNVSPFNVLDIGLTSQVILDHMHLIFLGVTKKFLNVWVKGKLPYKLGHRDISIINNKLLDVVKYTPREFHRKPRSLQELDHFKATEFRTFLLYTGIVVLRNVLQKDKYMHFVKLQCAAFILLSNSADDPGWNSFSNSILKKFVKQVSKLYCKEFLVYNVHNLIHLHQDALTYGNLNNVSCFPFEDFMQKLKRSIRAKKHVVQQVVNRCAEIGASNLSVTPKRKLPKKSILWNNFYVSNTIGDNCFRAKDGTIVQIQKISKSGLDVTLYCKQFKNASPLLHYPCSSDKLGIFIITSTARGPIRKIKISALSTKYFVLPYDSGSESFVCIPML